ncbi:hypothetical protein I3842_16G018900 [Carya illinoinensis]|uniref:Uncharacterized protein n=1 Tax=Carya illinoinensis TaxID=32201 RepID=A0A921ZZI5_CARIL|nr:hypothetical protein I3842_Q053100 [Carya illinoinensis]KAG6671737.1 hypothetical protein I3842_16G018900 [Carya illinoinensis]
MEAVYDNSRKGGMHYPVAFIAMLILLLLGANSCSGGAAVGIQLVKSNTTFGCDGRLDECLVEDDFELELLINPYISRILGKQGKGHTTDISAKRGKTITCGRSNDPKYASCIARVKGPKKVDCRGAYNRNCHPRQKSN